MPMFNMRGARRPMQPEGGVIDTQAGQPQGIFGQAFGGLGRFNERNPMMLAALGRVISGDDPYPVIQAGMAMKKDRRAEQKMTAQENATKALAKRMGFADDEIEAYAAAGRLGDLMKPKGTDDFMSAGDGRLYNKTTGEWVIAPNNDGFRMLTQDEETQMGLDPAGAYQMGADKKVSKIGGEGTTVNIDQKAEGAFDTEAAKKQAATFDTMATEGLNARADIGIIDELEANLKGSGGMMTGMSGWLAGKGFDLGEGTSDLQAAQALIAKLVPTQRQPGSGTMSDRDLELFQRSLPSLWNTPEGNQKIVRVMRGLAEYKQAQGEIADMVLMGEIDRKEARRLLRELPNPMAEIKGGAAAPPPASGGGTKRRTSSGIEYEVGE